jgi:hypothetical protein
MLERKSSWLFKVGFKGILIMGLTWPPSPRNIVGSSYILTQESGLGLFSLQFYGVGPLEIREWNKVGYGRIFATS